MKFIRLFTLVLLVIFLAGCTSISDLADLAGDVTAQEKETQGVIVEGVPNLGVQHFAGNVKIRDGEPGRISADLTKQSRLRNRSQAEAQLEQITMTFTQQGAEVGLTIQGPPLRSGLAASPTADLELSVPPGTTVDLNIGAGDITITEPLGSIIVNSGAGNITVAEPLGDVQVNGGAGNITVTLPGDASFRLVVAGGPIRVNSEFPGVPTGGLASNIDTTVGDNPTQTLTFNLGAGLVSINQAP